MKRWRAQFGSCPGLILIGRGRLAQDVAMKCG